LIRVDSFNAMISPSVLKTSSPDGLHSKSKYLQGLQCHKLLWHAIHAKNLIPVPDESAKALFDQGAEVGSLARALFPTDIEIGPASLQTRLEATRQALGLRRPIFEAAFTAHGAYAQVDILEPVDDGKWDIIEVKSSTGVDGVHLADVAFQYFVLTSAGTPVHRCWIMVVNNQYVRMGAVDPNQLFTKIDVTDVVLARSGAGGVRLAEMIAAANSPLAPDIQIGPHCDTPYPCPLHDHCWSFLPEGNVTELYRGKAKGFEFLRNGIMRLAEIPGDDGLTENQMIQRQAALTGVAHVDRTAIAAFLDRLEYPLHFLDFESFATAIPLIDNARPYQQIVFQFSLHVVDTNGSDPRHDSFLAEGRGDPRQEFISQLRTVVGETGSIIVYNASFEVGRLRECCELMPELNAWVAAVETRIVDLLEPFRSFAYYHPSQSGSASIKTVLPALTGSGYQGLQIQDGGAATREYLRVTWGDVGENERQRVRQHLEHYCNLDTSGMLEIIAALFRLRSNGSNPTGVI
jgi:hypothetical protein